MNLISIYRKIVAFTGMTVVGIIMSCIRYLSFGKGIEFNRVVFAPMFCRFLLFIVGVRVDKNIKVSTESVLYFFNHNSFLDIFIVPLLGLQNTRFIITEDTAKILPLHLCNLGINVLYIPTKGDPQRRLEFFKKVTSDLKEGKYSVICSPEGQHRFKHWIAPFNKGVFHMATESGRPIQNLFFNIPKDANPLESINMKSCRVLVESKDLIFTNDWKVDNLNENIESTRSLFLSYYEQCHGGLDESVV